MIGFPKRRLNVRLNNTMLYRYAAVLGQPSYGVIVGVFRHLNDVAALRI